MDNRLSVSRRALFGGGAGAALLGVMNPGIALARPDRPVLTHGVQTGDITPTSGLVWTRSDRPGRMIVEVSPDPSFRIKRTVVGPYLTPDADGTGRVINVTSAAGLTGTLGQVNYSEGARPGRHYTPAAPEWVDKPVGFVSYGNAGGARAVEQLRQVVVELKMLPIRSAIHIPGPMYLTLMHEPVPPNPDLFQPLKTGRVNQVERFFDELLWSARALKHARAGGP